MIGDSLQYKYIDDEAPAIKINYSYSKYWGKDFIESWRNTRATVLSDCDDTELFTLITQKQSNLWENEYVLSEKLLMHWLAAYENQVTKIDDAIFLLIKRFEVTRKIYFDYNIEMRPSNRNIYEDFKTYGLFGVLLGKLFLQTRKYPFLNALIKTNDIIVGRFSQMDKEIKPLMVLSIQQEVTIIEELLEKKMVKL